LGQTERPTDGNSVTNCGYVKAQLNLFVTPCKINFFQSFLDYTAVSQQQQTAHGAQNATLHLVSNHLCGGIVRERL